MERGCRAVRPIDEVVSCSSRARAACACAWRCGRASLRATIDGLVARVAPLGDVAREIEQAKTLPKPERAWAGEWGAIGSLWAPGGGNWAEHACAGMGLVASMCVTSFWTISPAPSFRMRSSSTTSSGGPLSPCAAHLAHSTACDMEQPRSPGVRETRPFLIVVGSYLAFTVVSHVRDTTASGASAPVSADSRFALMPAQLPVGAWAGVQQQCGGEAERATDLLGTAPPR